jgi:hypothetical protein
MITTRDGQDPRVLEDEFYAKEFKFSYSSLSKLVYGPKLFYKQYVLNEKDNEQSKSMLEGSIIHCLLLSPEIFDDNYVIAQTTVPSENVKEIIERVFKIYEEQEEATRDQLEMYQEEILAELVSMNLYQKMSDTVKIGKIVNETGIEYFNFLKQAKGKTVIDTETYSKCVDVVELVRNHSVSRLMGINIDDNGDALSEVEITMDMDDFPFGLKGHLDSIFIDHENKKVYVNDLKTSSRTLAEFPQSVIDYNYWMQAAIYMRLVTQVFSATLKNASDYTFVFNFIVVDKFNQIYAFEVSENTMTDWQIDLQEKLHEAKYHYESRDYSLPYKFVKSKVTL